MRRFRKACPASDVKRSLNSYSGTSSKSAVFFRKVSLGKQVEDLELRPELFKAGFNGDRFPGERAPADRGRVLGVSHGGVADELLKQFKPRLEAP